MADLKQSALALGKLIGLMDGSGGLQFAWFGELPDGVTRAIPLNRKHLEDLLTALVDDPAQDFGSGHRWVKLGIDAISGGVVWNHDPGGNGQALRLALGVKSAPIDGLALGVMPRLIQIDQDQWQSEFGAVSFDGGFPVPAFLMSGTVRGEVNPAGLEELSLTASADQNNSRTLAFAGDDSSDFPVWDLVRLATFVLTAWIRDSTENGFVARLNEHLLPMFGEREGVIEAFPAFQPMNEAPDFGAWAKSIIPSNANDLDGATTFLWHLRALLTGNENSDWFEGSVWLRLDQADGALGQLTPAGTLDLPEIPKGSFSAQPGPSAWIGVAPETAGQTNGPWVLLLVLRPESGADIDIPLARLDQQGLTRPLYQEQAKPKTVVDDLPETTDGFGFTAGAGVLTILSLDLPVSREVGGTLVATLLLSDSEPVGYRLSLGSGAAQLEFEFPTSGDPLVTAGNVSGIRGLLSWLGAIAGSVAEEPVPKALLQALAVLLDPTATVQAKSDAAWDLAIALAFDDNRQLQAGPLTLAAADSDAAPALTAEMTLDLSEFGDDDDQQDQAGKLIGRLDLRPLDGNPISAAKLTLQDLQLGNQSTPGTDLVGELLPDFRELPGFTLGVSWRAGESPKPFGGGLIPIQRTLGPLAIDSLKVTVDDQALVLGVNLGLDLAGILIAPQGLGITIDFDDGAVSPRLDGLALGFDASGVKLAGLFIESGGDYLGGALVSVAGLFELSAIGGYSQPNGETSLFIFAALSAPLGGPPWCFVTGVAGGFGYNRALPRVDRPSDHPFFQVMSGEIIDPDNIAKSLADLAEHFRVEPDSYWISAGLRFTSFGFIQGKLLAAVRFGSSFSVQLLGSAAFGLQPVAYFEIEFQMTADEEHFELIAGLSPNSYIIHPDIFSLHGQFALAVWYDGDHAGDFLLSIGGYHPYYPVPKHYPTLDRVGVKAQLYGFLHLSVEVFFATTPKAIMAGASLSLWGSFAGISAGLDVYIDVYIRWDPFLLRARLGVVVWFEFMGRHEIGVRLEIHTPPFGGIAVIDLSLVEFEIEFGEPLAGPAPLKLAEFLDSQLRIPARATNVQGARVAAFGTPDRAGLFTLAVLSGRAIEVPERDDNSQEGLDPKHPILVLPEFLLTVGSRLPVADWASPTSGNGEASIDGQLDLPLCRKEGLSITLIVRADQVHVNTPIPIQGKFPAAQFGQDAGEQQTGLAAATEVAQEDHDEVKIEACAGLRLDYRVPLGSSPDIEATEEVASGDEVFPLPLGGRRLTPAIDPGPALELASRRPIRRRVAALPQQRSVSTVATRRVAARLTPRIARRSLARRTEPLALRGAGFAHPPRQVPSINIPASPARRAELGAITLHLVDSPSPPPLAPPSCKRPRRHPRRLGTGPDAGPQDNAAASRLPDPAAPRPHQSCAGRGRTPGAG